MIDYRLAKELKGAGFPINKTIWERELYNHEPTECDFEHEWNRCVNFHPTIEELIEELGDNFHGLMKRGNKYSAGGPGETVKQEYFIYNTALEALVALYIRLNK